MNEKRRMFGGWWWYEFDFVGKNVFLIFFFIILVLCLEDVGGNKVNLFMLVQGGERRTLMNLQEKKIKIAFKIELQLCVQKEKFCECQIIDVELL